jgi:cytochrome c5
MGDRATVLQPIDGKAQWFAAAYLIAITPDLQRAALQRRDVQLTSNATTQAVASGDLLLSGQSYDLATSKKIFESTCVKCHALTEVSGSPPTTDKQVTELVKRMVGNGLTAPEKDLQQIAFYLKETYVKK